MTLIAIVGSLGEGKTLSLTYLAWLNNCIKGRNIFANYHLHTPIVSTFIHTIDEIDNIRDGIFCADELWYWIDSRASRKAKNNIIAKILLKSRKREAHIIYTTQSFGQIDKRIRNVTDYIIIPKLHFHAKVPGFKDSIPMKCTIAWYSWPVGYTYGLADKKMTFYTAPELILGHSPNLKYFNPNIFKLYDTTEEVGDLVWD